MNKYLAIDIGTSSIKVATYSENGEEISLLTSIYATYSPFEGWMEQNPEDWWVEVKRLLNNILIEEDPKSISCIVVCGQAPSCVPVDKDGKPLRPAIIWMDRRSESQSKWLKIHLDKQQLENSSNNLDSYFGGVKWLWFLQNEPFLYRKTWKILQASGFITYLLTGEASIDPSQAGLCSPCFNFNTGGWDERICKAMNLDINKLPSIFASDQIVGFVTSSASTETGLVEGIPVVCGGGDFAFACLSAGVYTKGKAALMLGTAGNLIIPDSEVADYRLINTFHVTGKRLVLGGVLAGKAISWIKEIIANNIDLDTLEEEARETLLEDDGLIFLPYLIGERTPVWDPNARGMFLGLSINHKRGHIYKAVLEGVCYAFKQIQEILQENGDYFHEVIAINGGAKSTYWRQIFSDVLQVPVSWLPNSSGTLLGAAFLAAKAIGQFHDYSCIDTWLGPTIYSYPQYDHSLIHQHKYRIYRKAYP